MNFTGEDVTLRLAVASLVEREARCECEAKHDIAMFVTMARAKIKTGETNILFIYLDFTKLFLNLTHRCYER